MAPADDNLFNACIRPFLFNIVPILNDFLNDPSIVL